MLAPRLFTNAPQNSCRRVAPPVRTSVPAGPRDLPARLSAGAAVLLAGQRDAGKSGKTREAVGIEEARPRSGAGALLRVSAGHRSRRPGFDAPATREGGAATRGGGADLRCSASARVAEPSTPPGVRRASAPRDPISQSNRRDTPPMSATTPVRADRVTPEPISQSKVHGARGVRTAWLVRTASAAPCKTR